MEKLKQLWRSFIHKRVKEVTDRDILDYIYVYFEIIRCLKNIKDEHERRKQMSTLVSKINLIEQDMYADSQVDLDMYAAKLRTKILSEIGKLEESTGRDFEHLRKYLTDGERVIGSK